MNQELKHNPKLSNVSNCHRLFHEIEEVQINGKTIFVTTKNSSYQIKKIVDNDKITHKIEN